ncbi:hypothetical protein A2442_01020 [Candidatus Campbellbacteria bacterium RIFOXYC2_FULL_35_25]|uniref:Uncharacterized protein n=1 Tax=Candidatus Campbellbacteria bacterium RIFOXYC2_FULL_35_25 TaxID=1797582 RepID=A0A1F5EIX2_9BACT|nr:MAG: hypothetical protein A2442_01020 [Candidatus Campbellbacteria bacterium RIFOXYC2_FULL_35_25]
MEETNMDMGNPTESTQENPVEKTEKSTGSIVGIIIVVIILLLGAFYFWGQRLDKVENGGEETTTVIIDTTADEVVDIEADLGNLENNVDDLGAEIDAIQAELNQ